jgi:biotin synthase
MSATPFTPDRQGLIAALEAPEAEGLKHRADAQRLRTKGSLVHLRGIIEFSNHCVRNCCYCGLRRANRAATRYRMAPDRVVEHALHIAEAGIGTVVLQSGDDLDYPSADIARMVAEIKRRAEMAVVLSVGERQPGEYERWRKAGADRYLMKHETSDPDLYARMHPGKTLEERLEALRLLKGLGYEIGTGFIVGLPGQTAGILADDVLLAREIGADMCGVGPFVPQAETPLAEVPPGDTETTLRLISLLRLACPGINLPATTALATLDPENGQRKALEAGANVIMPNFTPDAERANYRIYDHKKRVDLAGAYAAAADAGRCIVRDGRLKDHE